MGLSQRARAWTALLLPAVAWFSFQQGLAAVLRVDCTRAWVGLLWGAVALAFCAAGPWLGWRLGGAGEHTVHAWLARLARLAGIFFGLAITFQTLAVALVPPCAR